MIIQAFACVVVLFGVWFVPESPRFLIANGREEEAVAFLIKYHGNGDPNSRLVQLEVDEMKDGIRQDGIDKRPLDCTLHLHIPCVTYTLRTRLTMIDRSPLYLNP